MGMGIDKACQMRDQRQQTRQGKIGQDPNLGTGLISNLDCCRFWATPNKYIIHAYKIHTSSTQVMEGNTAFDSVSLHRPNSKAQSM